MNNSILVKNFLRQELTGLPQENDFLSLTHSFYNDRQHSCLLTQKAANLFNTYCQLTYVCRLYQYAYKLACERSQQRFIKEKPIYCLPNIKEKLDHAYRIYLLMQNNLLCIAYLLDDMFVSDSKSGYIEQIHHAIIGSLFLFDHGLLDRVDDLLVIFGASGYMSDTDISHVWQRIRQAVNKIEAQAMPLNDDQLFDQPLELASILKANEF